MSIDNLLALVEQIVGSSMELQIRRSDDGEWTAEIGHTNSGGDFWRVQRPPGVPEPYGAGNTLAEALSALLCHWNGTNEHRGGFSGPLRNVQNLPKPRDVGMSPVIGAPYGTTQSSPSGDPYKDLADKMKGDAKAYEIWSEGYAATGERGAATHHATVTATSFKAACDLHFASEATYDGDNLTLWGCRLFDNERAARKRYG